MKIISWNVNGIRSVQGKGFAETLARLDADCILLQETKAQADQIDKALEGIDGYHIYSNCAERKGYAGVTILSRHEPLQIINDIGIAEHDREGRVIVAEFEQFLSAQRLCTQFGRGIGPAGLPAKLGSGISGLLPATAKQKTAYRLRRFQCRAPGNRYRPSEAELQ